LTSIVSQEPQPTLEPQPLPLFGDRYSGIMEDISVSFLKLDWKTVLVPTYISFIQNRLKKSDLKNCFCNENEICYKKKKNTQNWIYHREWYL